MSADSRAMTGRVCLVTGATSGIGKATATALAGLGAKVVIHGRNPQKCADTLDEIRHVTGNNSLETIIADFASLDEVRRMALEIKERFPQLHVLVNNAGISLNRRRESRDRYELILAVNHLAPFLLTNLLLDTLVASAPARIVNVSSGLYKSARIDFDDLQATRRYSGMSRYGVSKLANVLFTIELARRLVDRGVTVNALGPGMVATNIGMEEGGMFAFSKKVMDRIMGKTPEQGAQTVVYLASSPEVEKTSGRYFEDMKEVPATAYAADPDIARRLWQVSEQLSGLTSV